METDIMKTPVIVGMFLIAASCFLCQAPTGAQPIQIESPNGACEVAVDVSDGIRYSVSFKGKLILKDCPTSMTLAGDRVLGRQPKLEGTDTRKIDQELKPVVCVKEATIHDQCVEQSLTFQGGYGLIFRVYDDAVAYRFKTALDGSIKVYAEQVVYRFVDDHAIYFPKEDSFLTHSERSYQYRKLSEIPEGDFASCPMLVDIQDGPKVLLTEADLHDYPGLYLHGTKGPALEGRFPAVAVRERQVNDRTVEVTERADYIAETSGNRDFPWRVCVIAEKDKDLIEDQTVYKLAPPCKLEDTSWIKPGKVAWDWWNANNIFGVDFRSGVNTATYKYYIDFASRYGIEYIILDEGWYKLGDLLSVVPEMNLDELFAYAKQKNVRIILWVVWKTLDDQLQPALDQFVKWGAAGIKVDFMQRDDRWMVNYYERIAREAAKRHLLVDFHGAYSPKGLRRAYPNVLTREGVKGLEHCKWSRDITPEHCVTLPFIRMVNGPMDFTPGAMVNAQEKNFNPVFERPMSQGTRCQQLAMYVVYESPLQMLADSPSHYLREPECMDFLSKVPSVWDETIALDAKVADYVLVARRSGEDWYVGAMTDWTPRGLTVDLSFLGQGNYNADIYQDGVNADRYGNDFKRSSQRVTAADKLTIKLAPGGGWVARLTK
jgi:alpha-glucosidase